MRSRAHFLKGVVMRVKPKKKRGGGNFSTRAFSLVAVVFAIVSFSASAPLVLRADTSATLTDEQKAALEKAQNAKEDDLDALKDKIDLNKKAANLKGKESDQLAAQAAQLAAQSDTLQDTITDNSRRLADLEQQMESLESRVKLKEDTIEVQKELLSSILRSYYDSQSRAGGVPAFALASVGDFDEMVAGRDGLFDTGSGVKETLANIVNLRNSLVHEHDVASEKKVEIASVKLQLEQQNSYLENSRKNKEILSAQAAAEQNRYKGIVSELEKQRKEIEDEIEQLDAARAGKIDLSEIPNFSSGILGYPVKSPHKTQGYGKTTFTKWYTFHNGVDFADSVGTPVLAAEDGEVVAMGDEGKYAFGKWIAIEHDNGLTTLYGHLSKQSVDEGEKVDRGEKIGLMGSTGYSTGSHVHFGVYTSKTFEVVKSSKVKGLLIPTGTTIDPEKYL